MSGDAAVSTPVRRYRVRRALSVLYASILGVMIVTSPDESIVWPTTFWAGLEALIGVLMVLAIFGYAIGYRPRRGAWFWNLFPWGILAWFIYEGNEETLVSPKTTDDVALTLGVVFGSMLFYPLFHLLFRFRAVGRLPDAPSAQSPRGLNRWLGLRAERDVWSGAVSHPRWFQFGIRGPALVVTLWCVWLGLKVEQLRGQREAVARLEANYVYLRMHKLTDLESAVSEYLPDDLLVDVRQAYFREGCPGDSLIPDLLKCRCVEDVKIVDDNKLFTDRGARELGNLPMLKEFNAGSIEISDDTLTALSRHRVLEELIVCSPRMTDVGIRAIAICPLKVLALEGVKITDAGVQALGDCRSLYSLSLSGTGMTDRGLAAIGRLPELHSLELFDVAIDGSGFAEAGDKPQLTRLLVANSKLNDMSIAHLAKIPSLEDVSIANAPLTDASAENFRQFDNLREVSLHDVAVTDVVFMSLCSLQRIRIVIMERTRVNGESVWRFSQLPPKKMILDFSDSPLTNSGFAAIVNKLDPISLDASGTRITDVALRMCKPSTNVVWLDFANTWITDEAIAECRKFPGLQSLDCNWTFVTLRCIGQLQNMPALEQFRAEGTPFDLLSDEEIDKQFPNVMVWTRRLTEN